MTITHYAITYCIFDETTHTPELEQLALPEARHKLHLK